MSHRTLARTDQAKPRSGFACDIRPGRRPRGKAGLDLVEDYRRRAGVKT